jgi:hypothetical protein
MKMEAVRFSNHAAEGHIPEKSNLQLPPPEPQISLLIMDYKLKLPHYYYYGSTALC